MINFKNTRFIKSLPSIKLKEDDKLKEVLFVGRSNVGKSSLLNCLCDNKNLAFPSDNFQGFSYIFHYRVLSRKGRHLLLV